MWQKNFLKKKKFPTTVFLVRTSWQLDNGWNLFEAAFCNLAMSSERTLNFHGLDCLGGLFVQTLTFWNLFGGKIQPIWRCTGPTSAPDHGIIWRLFNSETRCHYQRAYLLKIQPTVKFCKQALVLRLSISNIQRCYKAIPGFTCVC